MAEPISTFTTFVGLLLAARKLAMNPDIFNRAEALVTLAKDGPALTAALRRSGLTPLAQEMETCAKDADRAFAHAGQAKEDARAIFQQVAPAALSDPEAIVGGGLVAAQVTDRMVAAIRASPQDGHHFAHTPMAET